MGAFTHPLMYKTIESKASAMSLYSKQLIDDGVVKPEQYEVRGARKGRSVPLSLRMGV